MEKEVKMEREEVVVMTKQNEVKVEKASQVETVMTNWIEGKVGVKKEKGNLVVGVGSKNGLRPGNMLNIQCRYLEGILSLPR